MRHSTLFLVVIGAISIATDGDIPTHTQSVSQSLAREFRPAALLPLAFDVAPGFVLLAYMNQEDAEEFHLLFWSSVELSTSTQAPTPAPMRRDVFAGLWNRLDTIKTVGTLVKSPDVYFSSMAGQIGTSEYTNAVVELRESSAGVLSCRIAYFRPMIGRVDAVESGQVRIAGSWYWVPSQVLARLAVGQDATLLVAGPVNRPVPYLRPAPR